MRRITQIRRSLASIFNIRNEMVRAVDDRDEAALRKAIQTMREETWSILVDLDRSYAEDQEAMEREA